MRYFLFFQAVFLPWLAVGQGLVFRNYSLEEGLPSSEVHDIYQDQKGYMWFATDNGIARFDGKEFIPFHITPDGSDECAFNFFPQSPACVWVATSQNRLYRFNPQIYPVVFYPCLLNRVLTEQLDRRNCNEFIRNVWLRENNLCASFLQGSGCLEINREGEGACFNLGKPELGVHYTQNMLINVYATDTLIYAHSQFIPAQNEENAGMILVYDERLSDTLRTGQQFQSVSRIQYGVADCFKTDNKIYLLVGRFVFIYCEGTITTIVLPSEGLKMAQLDDELFVTGFKGCYRYSRTGELIGNYFPENIVTCIYQDVSGGIWLGTLEDGIYYARSKDFYQLGRPGEKIVVRDIQVDSAYVFCSTLNSQLLVFDHSGVEKERFERVYAFRNTLTTEGVDLEKYFGPPMPQSAKGPLPAYSIAYKNKKRHIGASNTGYAITTADSSQSIRFEEGKIPYINGACEWNDTLYFVTEKGLYYLSDPYSPVPVDYAHAYRNETMTGIQPLMDGFIISTKNSGLIYLDRQKSFRFTRQHGLISNTISQVQVVNDSVVWAGTREGLMRLQWNNIKKRLRISVVNTEDGLLRGEMLCVNVANDTVWTGTKGGTFFFPDRPELYEDQFHAVHFSLDSIAINGSETARSTDTVFLSYGDFIEFFFRQLAFFKDAPISYEYSLTGDHSIVNWQPVQGGRLAYRCEEPGYSVLRIRPEGAGYDLRVVIYTAYPFWYRWWFYALLVVVVSIITWTIARLMGRYQARKKEKEIEKLQLEMRSLLSQMNPHFTFNTINSIQYYLINNTAKDAVLYLADFALLIRRTLEYSRREFITLREELDFLELYTGLENKRFNYGFTVEFDLALRRKAEEIRFPSLLIQPVVENAIIHGVSKKKSGEGRIIISIHEMDNHFVITVTDNGDGFDPGTINKPGKSFGIDILKNRVRLYNGVNFTEQDFRVNILNEEGITGTAVQIKLFLTKHESTDH